MNRSPNAEAPDAVGAGNSDREVCSVFSTALRDGEQRANGRFVVSHPGYGARYSIDSTIGTSHADRPDESNLFAAIQPVVAMR